MDTATDFILIQLLIMIIDDINAIHVALTVDICQEVNHWMILLLWASQSVLTRTLGITCYILGFSDICLLLLGLRQDQKTREAKEPFILGSS